MEVQGNLPTSINDIRAVTGTPPAVYAATNNGIYKILAPTAAPLLVSPANNTSTNRIVPSLFWNTVTYATGYRLQISKSSTFDILMTNQQLSTTSYIPTYLNVGGVYYWRVLANNFFGQTSYSSVYSFTATANSETIPISGSKYWDGVDYHPQLTWGATTQNTPPFYVYRWVCSFEQGACCPNDQVPIAITNNTTFIDYGVVAGDKTDMYNGSYYYVIKSASISDTKSFFVDGGGGLPIVWKTGIGEGADKNSVAIPTEYKLGQNTPNPFNPSTIVNYQLPADNYVTIKVYNILGEEVATLVDGFENAGYKSVTFNGSNLSSGIYFVRMNSGSYSDIKKIVLAK